MEIKNLYLTDIEKNKFNKVARDNKYSKGEKEMMYSDFISKAQLFVNYCNFLFLNLKNVEFDKVLQDKLEVYTYQFKDIYDKFTVLLDEYFKTNVLKKSIINKKIIDLFLKTPKINIILTDIFPIGRTIKEYDPEEYLGAY